MQDNTVYKLELTEDEFNIIEKAKKEYLDLLSKMPKEERLQYFRDNYCLEKNLHFEKEINKTVYKVNAHFNELASESIIQKIYRMTQNK